MPKNRRIMFLVFCGFLAVQNGEAVAAMSWLQEDPATSCDAAAATAARKHGVPEAILKAIARVESGRSHAGQFAPWPWTVNVEGTGSFYQSKAEAVEFVRTAYQNGNRSIDAGCFQINLKWHGHHFQSVEQALSPIHNANYAAKFLNELYAEFGSWETAAGTYHSRNLQHSTPYLARFRTALRAIETSQHENVRAGQTAPLNTFPLLHGQSNSLSRGSLFPQTPINRRGFFNHLEKQS